MESEEEWRICIGEAGLGLIFRWHVSNKSLGCVAAGVAGDAVVQNMPPHMVVKCPGLA